MNQSEIDSEAFLDSYINKSCEINEKLSSYDLFMVIRTDALQHQEVISVGQVVVIGNQGRQRVKGQLSRQREREKKYIDLINVFLPKPFWSQIPVKN